jgi:hypothetical protein
MLSVLLAALVLVAPVQTTQETPAATPPAAEAAPDAESATRRVCRFETVIGSNRRTRVCRDVPRQGVQDQATRDYMRDSQRVRTLPVG